MGSAIKRYPLLTLFISSLLILAWLDAQHPLSLPNNQGVFARVVVDENNRPLRTFADNNGIWRYPIDLSTVSPLYIEALLNYEDRWFWYHPGFNPLSLLRAAGQNIINGRIVSGGSTLSMQVARILHPHERSLWGKTKQMFRTLQLEWHLNKTQILQLYLNNAPFGGTIEGVQAASYTYLNKSAVELTHAEAALLAVLPQAPTRYRPDLHHKAAQKARDKVLQRLADFKTWSQETVDDAKLEQVFSFNYRPNQLAPLLSRRLLSQHPNKPVIRTTIDRDLQQSLQDTLMAYMQSLPKQTSGAVLVIDNKTAAVKAYLGTADFANASRFGYVDMVQAIRSPGSTLKPFIYGLAIDDGLIHSQSLLADVPRHWGTYRPSNFNGAFNGPVSASDALQRSLNMPAVDLLERYGVKRFVGQLANAGVQLSIPNQDPNLAIILGGLGTSLEQLVQGYSALANQGQVKTLRYLKHELNMDKNTRQLLSPASAWVIQDILSGISRPGSIQTLAATRHKNTFAWKTGTSYGYRDAWAIGVNKDYTFGVWLGRPDGTAVPGHYGRITAGPLLFNVADQLNINAMASAINKPKNVVSEIICWPLGIRLTDQDSTFCQQKKQAWIVDEVVPPTWHIADSDAWQGSLFSFWYNPQNNRRVSLDCPVPNKQHKQIAIWPKVLEPWLNAKAKRATLIPPVDPQCNNTLITPSSTLKIIGIEANSIFKQSGNDSAYPSVWLKTLGGDGVKHWYINGEYSYEAMPDQNVEHVLRNKGEQQIVVQDEQGNSDMITVYFQ